MRNSITILVVALLAACASNDGPNTTSGLALDIEPAPSEPGEEVSLALTNGSEFQLAYNLCTARLSHQRGAQWVSVASGGECPTEREVLEPGGEASYDFTLPEAFDGGSYRFSVRVEVDGTRTEEIFSPTFQMPEYTPPDTADA